MKALSALAVAALLGCAYAGEPGEGADVVQITNDNFREEVIEYDGLVLVEFYAPWCGHCKTLAPEWAKAATALKGKVKVAALDATQHGDTAKMFDVSGYPTVLQFPFGKKEDEEGVLFDQFSGRDADTIIDAAAEILQKNGVDITQIEQLVDSDSLDSCLSKKYCAVFNLPHVVETGAEGRNQYIETIKELARTMGRSNPTGYIWVEAGSQPALENAFSASSYPGLTLINKDRSRYVNHIGAFNAAALAKTIRSVQTGRKAPSTYKVFPKIEKSEKWDGKDYVYDEEM
eukprot:TRINITY_DN10974_c0_g1_i1.p1 TRINITY_DN10974_c0_g1~~TRINITY_DN10974_c0_g1_i1.p1  ORF type:complete len:303 (+),score=141.80 TRINITY_DN10974_c0_g1_i1:48-911(+)